ncbi:MAG: hypothetical protein ACR2F6_03205 [Mycobacteriales bacterium]
MQHARPQAVEASLVASWHLAEPLTVRRIAHDGVTSDVFDVTDAAGRRYAAKLTYDLPAAVEPGLRAAAAVARRTSIETAPAVPASGGSLTVLTPSVNGERHPLALLPWIDGRRLAAGERIADAARVLAAVHQALGDVEAPDTMVGYLGDDAARYPWRDVIVPASRAALEGVFRADLTWGACYGDGPELVATEDGLALRDWGAVTRGPLLWDVKLWAGEQREAFVEAYAAARGPAAGEAHLLTLMDRLGYAFALRFRAFRVAQPDHYDETIEADRAALAEAAAGLGLDPDRTLADVDRAGKVYRSQGPQWPSLGS